MCFVRLLSNCYKSHPFLHLLHVIILSAICDNARIHKGDIDEVIFQAGHQQLFLPPYSPELNRIEYIFSKWKLAYRMLFPATEEEVDDAIRKSATSITPKDCLHDFEHTRT